LRGEWKAVSDELRQKAAALGGDLTSIVGEVHEGLQIEAPKPTETPATEPDPQATGPGEVAPAGGAVAQGSVQGGEADASAPVE
jgi:hypothetical protein